MAVLVDVLVVVALISNPVIVYISLMKERKKKVEVLTFLYLQMCMNVLRHAPAFHTWSGLCSNGQLSHWSPTPSLSVSFWSVLYTYGQLSSSFRISVQEEQLIRIYYIHILTTRPNRIIIVLNLFGFHSFTISINIHRTGISFSIVVGVDLCWVMFVRTVVAAIANFIFVKIELARIVEQGTVVLLCGKSVIFKGLPRACSQPKMFPCVYIKPRTLSSRIPSLSSSLSQASPWPSLSKSSCPELGRLGQLS